MKKRLLASLLAIFCSTSVLIAQAEDHKVVDFSATLQTNHLWRGLVICDKPMAAILTTFNFDREGTFTGGFWGGMAISNETDGTHYKEINYYLQFSKGGFTVGLWDLFNTRNLDKPDIWNYKKRESTHILDLRTSYHFGESFPLTLEADVLLFGSADIQFNGTDVKQRYSTYVQASYEASISDLAKLKPFIGAGFALNGETHLYNNADANKFDIVNLGLTVSKDIKINDFTIPVQATTLWNPSQKYARVQLAISLF